MATVEWTLDDGWHDASIHPYGPLSLDPSASVLHYAQEIFEGLKAYRHADGSVWTFRPDANARRFAAVGPPTRAARSCRSRTSSSRSGSSCSADADWVPSAPETSLYLRPFMIATESFLGVRAAQAVSYHCIASPAGAYFTSGPKPVSIWLSTQYARAGTRRDRCGEDRRQLRLVAAARSRRRTSTAASR